jgi:hypothetical protein
VRNIEDAEAIPHRVMLIEDARVLHRHRPAAEIHHARAEPDVFGMERSLEKSGGVGHEARG